MGAADRVDSEVRRFDPSIPIEQAWMAPSSWYLDPEILALELRSVFGASWQPVARRADLTGAGAYQAGILPNGDPFVVLRGEDGALRAFHNVCRHKGREVVQGAGRCERLVCGYHAWTYDLEGRLKTAPRIAGIRDFDRAAMSLPPMAVEEWGPWVFVHAGVPAQGLRASLEPLDRALAKSGWDRLMLHSTTSWTLECNWKVYVDNYLDGGYHIPHMHPSLDAQLDMTSYRTEVFDRFSVQRSAPTTAEREGLGFDARQRIGPGALYAWIHPNFMLNRYGPCLDSNLVIPRGPDRCEVVYEFYFAEADGAEALEFLHASIEQSAITQQEDIAICESVQVGMRSSRFDRGRYAPQVEIGEHHFHCLLAADLRAGLAELSKSDAAPGEGTC